MKWFLGALLFLFLALVLQAGLLAYAMYVLLGLLFLSRFLTRSWIEGLSATRACNRYAAEVGDTVAIVVTVRNDGKLPVLWVLLEDLLPRKALGQKPPRLKVKGKRMQISMVPRGEQRTLTYQLQLKMRGYYQIGPLVLESGDLFGLHRRYRVGADPEFVLVYPKLVPLEGYDLASRRPIGEIRLTHRLFEDPTRIGGVRHYEAGDPLNRIHWRATARTGLLHSKVYEPSSLAGATLLLDFHQAGYHRRGEPYRSELAVTAAASLANAVYLMGQQVGLITNGRDAADRIRQEGWDHDYRTRQAARANAMMQDESDRLQPLIVETRRGVEQFQRIRETLARVELTDGLTLAQLVTETSSRMPRDATVVALLPDVPPETAVALGSLRRHGYAVAAILLIMNDDQFALCSGLLIAEGVEVRHLKDEARLAALCQKYLLS